MLTDARGTIGRMAEPDWSTLREGDVAFLDDDPDQGPLPLRVGADALYPQEYPTVHWDHPRLTLPAAQALLDAGDPTLVKRYDAATNRWRG